jgi:microcystin-dependent protein
MSGTSIGNRFVQPLQQILSPEGIPWVGAQAFFYATGTGTLQNTYADVLCTVPNPNPVLTNSAGFWPQIFMIPAPAYRVRVEDPAGGVIYDVDPVSGVPTTGYGSYIPGYVPPGAIMPFAGGTPPSGWLFCDGSEVSRTVFTALFSVIGGTFGSGDGSTTFNLPDLRGSVVVGKDNMGGVAAGRITAGNSGVDGATLGAMGGSELLQSHDHALTDPGHDHSVDDHHHEFSTSTHGPPIAEPITGTEVFMPGGGLPAAFPHIDKTDPASGGLVSNTTGIVIDPFGGGSSQNIPPSLICLYIIFGG